MKNKKSRLDIFLHERIEENRAKLRHSLDSSLQVERKYSVNAVLYA